MDEKRLLLVEPAAERRAFSPATFRRRLRQRLGVVAALVVIALTVAVFFQPDLPLSVSAWCPKAAKEELLRTKAPKIQEIKTGLMRPVLASSRLVPLEAHIMSKCPDARDCLRDLVLPTMQQVYDKVNFTLSYVGRPTSDGGVECMHGPGECMGNIIELCAHALYPDPKIYLGFTFCLSRDYPRIPDRELVEDCALEHAIDFAALNDCAAQDDGQYGVTLLRDSVRHTSVAGVTKSCTVRLDDKVYCIRDGGEWKDCPAGPGVHDLIIAVEKLYRQG